MILGGDRLPLPTNKKSVSQLSYWSGDFRRVSAGHPYGAAGRGPVGVPRFTPRSGADQPVRTPEAAGQRAASAPVPDGSAVGLRSGPGGGGYGPEGRPARRERAERAVRGCAAPPDTPLGGAAAGPRPAAPYGSTLLSAGPSGCCARVVRLLPLLSWSCIPGSSYPVSAATRRRTAPRCALASSGSVHGNRQRMLAASGALWSAAVRFRRGDASAGLRGGTPASAGWVVWFFR